MTAPAGIVWLASFPKSGNTWFRIFLANLMAGRPVDINNLSEYCGLAGSRIDFDAATMLYSGLLSPDDVDGLRAQVYADIARRAAQPRWMKVHDAFVTLPGGEPLLGRAGRAAIYLVRDPRDVAISLAHHNSLSIDDAIVLMNRTDRVLCPGGIGLETQLRQKLRGWSGHVTSWIDQDDIPVHLVRYEDLAADPLTGFGRALTFIGHGAGTAEIARAMREADFSELQRREREEGFAERQPGAAPFFRTGKPGSWRHVLDSAQRARIEGAHAAVMERLGYAFG